MTLVHAQASVSLDGALVAAQAAVARAQALGRAVAVAVVDPAGLPVAFLRMPGTALHSAGIAMDKAYTAVSFGRPTGDWPSVLNGKSDAVRDGLLRRERFVAMAGGLPILVDGARVGAIGVSGASELEDAACAAAGLTALGPPPAAASTKQR